MQYPGEHFLRDYEAFQNPLLPLPKDISPESYFEILKGFFQVKYGANSPIAEDRCDQFRKAMALITNSEPQLISMGLVTKRPAKYGALLKASVLLAAHELVNARGFSRPTPEQLKEVIQEIEGREGKPPSQSTPSG